MKSTVLPICAVISFIICTVSANLFTIQFNDKRIKENHPMWDLTNTSNGKALILESEKTLTYNFCLRTWSNVTVKDFRFSNGNLSEKVLLTIDQHVMGSFWTPTNQQHSWNLFLSTGEFPMSYVLPVGLHRLMVKFEGKADGIAIDYIELDIADDKLSQDIFSCELTCIDGQNYNVRSNDVPTSASYIVQESYKTSCPEVDNINIPIFNNGVEEYEITATLPKYRAFSNWREENNTGCPHLSPFYWSFNNIGISSSDSYDIETPKAKIYFGQGNDVINSKVSVSIIVTFNLEGKSKGMVDSEMGTILKMKFRSLTAAVKVEFKYKGRHQGLSDPVMKHITQGHPIAEWETPDFSWTDNDLNLVILQVSSNSSKPLHMDFLNLERRPMLPDEVKSVYRSDDYIVEVITGDFWWTNPDSMTVHLSTGSSYHNVSYFRIYRSIPWNDGYAQVFVLYQDGNARLLPVPPEGLDWIPFGSSVIIGQTDPTVVRPYASITDTYIDVKKQTMNLIYKDGGSCLLTLATSLSETRVVVKNIHLARNPMVFPFTTFRSMYVSEGNNDVDHLIINGIYSVHIMDEFRNIIGRNFVFHRKCMSRHLNFSPDIYIDIRKTWGNVFHMDPYDTNAFRNLLKRIRDHRSRLWTPRIQYSYI